MLALLLLPALLPRPLAAQPPARGPAQQGAAGEPVLMTPGGSTGVTLQTHTTDITLTDGSAAAGSSFYRLRNESTTDALVSLAFSSAPGDLSVTANGEPLGVQGGQASVYVPAGGRTDVRVRYSYALGSGVVLAVRFPAATLNNWPGATSFRLTVNVPASIPRESWLRTAPEGWRFGPSESAGTVAIQWLYEGRIPAEPLVFAYANPALWNEIVQRRAAAESGGVPEWIALGESYARLATETTDAGIRDRFYGQALAAYSTALDRGAVQGASPADLAPVHAGQAALYRQRIIGPNGEFSPEHAQLLVDAVAAALGGLPADHPRRTELTQWLSDGLQIVLDGARAQRDWETALDTLDQLAAAGSSAIDPAFIEQERRTILFEQSLQLLEEGQRDEAVAVSGSDIVNAELQPPAEQQALFASWQVTITARPRGSVLEFVGIPTPGRELAAGSAATELADTWAAAASSNGAGVTITAPAAEDPTLPVELVLRLPAGATGLPLANVTPLRADWALLRAVLAQVAPEVESETTFLRQSVLLRLPLDLRSAGEPWQRLADALAQEADQLAAQPAAAGGAGDEAAALEAELRAKVQAANRRAEANNWSRLLANSQVVTLLEGPRGAPADARAWQITVADPPQTLQYASWGINSGGVLVLAAGALVVLLLLAGLLWSLLA